MNENASSSVSDGPALIAVTGMPSSTNSTRNGLPSGTSGTPDGASVTDVIDEFGNSDT